MSVYTPISDTPQGLMKKFQMPMASIINSIRYIHINVGTTEFSASWAKSLVAAAQRGLSNLGLLKQRPNGILDGATEAALNKAFPPFGRWRRMTWFNVLSGLASQAQVKARRSSWGKVIATTRSRVRDHRGVSGLGNYVQEHALYGIGDYVSEHALMGLGAIPASTWTKSSSGVITAKSGQSATKDWFTYLQVQANRAATKLGFGKVNEDGKIGSGTVSLAKQIVDANPMTIQPFSSPEDLAAYAKEYGDQFRQVASSTGQTSVTLPKSQEIVTSYQPTPTVAAPKSSAPTKKKGKKKGKTPPTQIMQPDAQMPQMASIGGIPSKWLLIGGGAAVIIYFATRGRSSAPAPAALPAPAAIPKGV